ncbi:MAG: hypothetical protein GXP02_08825 [Alphaproteobacteria bacterium]|nr:hypothetical protein [Alphaproteobacteria bacterium]
MSKIFDSTGLPDPAERRKSSDNITGAKITGNDTTGLFVSLYLIVLAFFVVLNSISNQVQNKVNAATESVTRAFRNPYAPKADFIDILASKDAVTPNDEFYQQIQGVFASLIGFDGRFPTEGGSVLKVDFKTSDLFERGTSIFRPDQKKFLQRLAKFLSDGDVGERREIKIAVSSGKALPQGPEYWKNLTILRAGAFAPQLKKMGVAGNQISVGITTGVQDRMTLTFYTRQVSAVVQSLSGRRKPAQKAPVQKAPEKNNGGGR